MRTSDGEVHFVGAGVHPTLLHEVEDADGRRHGHLKEPAATVLRRHHAPAPLAQT